MASSARARHKVSHDLVARTLAPLTVSAPPCVVARYHLARVRCRRCQPAPRGDARRRRASRGRRAADDARGRRVRGSTPRRVDARARARRARRARRRPRVFVRGLATPRRRRARAPRDASRRRRPGTASRRCPRPRRRRLGRRPIARRPPPPFDADSSVPTASESTSYRFAWSSSSRSRSSCATPIASSWPSPASRSPPRTAGARARSASSRSSFLWGYALTPLLGGVLADRYGGKAVLGGGILLWSVATRSRPAPPPRRSRRYSRAAPRWAWARASRSRA